MKIQNPSLPYAPKTELSLALNAPISSPWDERPKVLIGRTSISAAVATVDFVLPDHFHFIEILIRDLRPATNGADLKMRFSFNNGASYAAGASDYAWALWGGNTTTGAINQIDAADTGILCSQTTNGLGSTNPVNSYAARILLMNPFGGRMFPTLQGEHVSLDGGAVQTWAYFSGIYRIAASGVNGIRIMASTGNLTQGVFSVYGIN